MEQMDKLAREPHSIVISCEQGLNLDYLVDRIWEELELVRIYTKKRGEHPDLDDPLVVRVRSLSSTPIARLSVRNVEASLDCNSCTRNTF